MHDSGVMKMNNNNSSESSVFTERVVQGPDRVYRWKYTLRKEQALVHYKMMMKIGMIVATAGEKHYGFIMNTLMYYN